MATKFKITADGETTEYTVKPKHILKAERNGGIEATAESSFMLAWYAAGSPGEFEEWLDTVDDIVVEGEDVKTEDEVPPTTKGSRTSRS